ncbi:hypothetical protein M8J76_005519 [Diaphorina citri]|nr:hypothetical protein M8J76_005519 [Diaphorina citri]
MFVPRTDHVSTSSPSNRSGGLLREGEKAGEANGKGKPSDQVTLQWPASVPATGPHSVAIREGLEQVFKQVLVLKESLLPNTRVEIRKGVEMAHLVISKMAKDVDKVHFIDENLWEAARRKDQNNSRSTKRNDLLEEIQSFKETPREKQDMGKLKELLRKDWPQDAFQATKVKIGNPIAESQGENLAFWLGGDTKGRKALLDIARGILPEVATLVSDGSVVGGFQIIETLTRLRGQESDVKERNLYLVEGETTEDLVKRLGEMLEDGKGKKLFIAASHGGLTGNLRKLVELGSRGEEVFFIIPAGTKLSGIQSQGRSKEQQQEQQGTVRVESENLSYAEISKIIKETVNLEEIGVGVKSLRKTKKDNLVIVTEKKECANTLKNAIESNVQSKIADMKIAVGGEKSTIMIRDIEGSVSQEEVMEAIQKETKSTSALEIKMSKNWRGSLTAEISMNKDEAKKLIEVGKIKIGWSVCRVKNKIILNRCYGCLRMGHSWFECRSVPLRLFFLWGYLKERVYREKPRTLHELKEAITEEIRRIPWAMLGRVATIFISRLDSCITADGRHMLDVNFRT